MIEELTKVIISNWSQLPISPQVPTPNGLLSFTKFCQRIVGRNTKVLFFVSHAGQPVCIIKTVRDPGFNQRLEKEKRIQKQICSREVVTPEVYFDGFINDRYFYAEQVVWGTILSPRQTREKQSEIMSQVKSFPVAGEVPLQMILALFSSSSIFRSDKKLFSSLEFLSKQSLILKMGLSHGDLGRPNLLTDGVRTYLIDWERANDTPFWLIDGVSLLVKINNICNFSDWESRALSIFINYTGVTSNYANILYYLVSIFDILYKQYPAEYARIIEQLPRL